MVISKNGMFAIVGRPNVGKSTLLNALAGEKVAIVTDKPQTTRTRISAVVNKDETQYVFLDTPGFHKPRSRLGDFMVKAVSASVGEVDAVLLMVEASDRIGTPERLLIEQIAKAGVPAILLINKTDALKVKELLLPCIDLYSKAHPFAAILPVSARTGAGLDALWPLIGPFALDGPALYPEGMASDQPERQLLAELLREKLLRLLDREVPHGLAVVTETLGIREDGMVEAALIVYCEKESHKGIVIGKHGDILRRAGSEVRTEWENITGKKVFLETWVKVKENWRDKENQLRQFGFHDV
jgi:GTP-binding protein Era